MVRLALNYSSEADVVAFSSKEVHPLVVLERRSICILKYAVGVDGALL